MLTVTQYFFIPPDKYFIQQINDLKFYIIPLLNEMGRYYCKFQITDDVAFLPFFILAISGYASNMPVSIDFSHYKWDPLTPNVYTTKVYSIDVLTQ